MKRLISMILTAFFVVGLFTIANEIPADAAPDTTETTAVPAHIPWPDFTFDVCSFTMISKMQLPANQFFVHRSDIQTAHFGGHFVYCAARLIGGSSGSNSICWLIHYEQNRLVDSWGAPIFQCN